MPVELIRKPCLDNCQKLQQDMLKKKTGLIEAGSF